MQYPSRSIGPLVPEATFSPEMVQGYSPPYNARLPFKTQHPQPLSQTTQVNAPFSIEMVAGSSAIHGPLYYTNRGWSISLIDVVIFTFEATRGITPPQPRLFTAPRIPLPIGAANHVAAPFSIEEVRSGSVPFIRINKPHSFNMAIVDPIFIITTSALFQQVEIGIAKEFLFTRIVSPTGGLGTT